MSDQAIATFRASIPSISGAVRMHGEGDSRAIFEIPEVDMDEVHKLQKYGRNRALYVVVMAADTREG